MITVSDQMYEELAEQLLWRLDDAHFFNGSIEYDSEDFYSSLICTLIICRDTVTDKILSILPVWWEYNLSTQDGLQPNDFSWTLFNLILEKQF